MPKFLAKREGKIIDFVSIPKSATVERTAQGLRIKQDSKIGVPFKDFKVFEARSEKDLLQKLASSDNFEEETMLLD